MVMIPAETLLAQEQEATDRSAARTHPMSEPWLKWEPMSTFPRDGEGYLVWDDRVLGGNPEVVFWDDEAKDGAWCLATSDGPSYHVDTFTHWARVPGP